MACGAVLVVTGAVVLAFGAIALADRQTADRFAPGSTSAASTSED